MKQLMALLLTLTVFTACNNSGSEQSKDTTASPVVAMQPGLSYKRFSGTIAGQPVVLHLSSGNGALSGTYYYVKQGKPISIYGGKNTAVTDGYNVQETPTDQSDMKEAMWKFTLKDNTITGKWISGDSTKIYDINLKEEYPAGSYQLSVWEKEDSIRYKADRPQPTATVSYKLLRGGNGMKSEDVQLLEKLIMHELGADSLQAMTVEDCVKKQIANYATWYREIIGEDTSESSLMLESNNYYSGVAMDVIFNDNNWLVMEMSGSEYTGGAHGNYGVSYINVDMQQKRVWKMEDILVVDTVQLHHLLVAEAKRYCNVQSNAELGGCLLEEEILPNGNVYLTPTGITFVYNPYEIASYAQGIISLFIPYNKLKPLLTPAFKQRMVL